MVFDRTEHEPDEYDPEEEFRDPDSDSLTIPRVSTENAGSDLRSDLKSELEEDAVEASDVSSVDGETLKNFWALVLVINALVLAYALGLMFLVFEGATTYASYLFAVGLVLTGFAIRRYRNFQRERDGDSDSRTDGRDDGKTADTSAADGQTEGTTDCERSESPTAADDEGADGDVAGDTGDAETERK